MTEKRTVECLDCGYRWESSASDPRCSQSECGRSRNVEPVNGEPDEQDDPDGLDSESSTTTEQFDSDSTEHMDPEDDSTDDDSGSDGGFTPAFETRQETTSTDSVTTAEAPSLDSTSTESTSSEDASTEDASTDEQDEASGGPDPAEDIPEIDPEQLEVAFEVTFEAVAARRGDHWELNDGEAAKLGKAWSPVANEYAPILFREHTAVGVALVATVSVLMPRLAKDRELQELADQREREEANGEPGSERSPSTVEDDVLDAEDDSTEWPDEQPADQTNNATGGYANV